MELAILGLDKERVLQEDAAGWSGRDEHVPLWTRKDEDVVQIYKHSFDSFRQFNMSLSTSLTRAWNTALAFASSNGTTRYSWWPAGVLKAVFHSSLS